MAGCVYRTESIENINQLFISRQHELALISLCIDILSVALAFHNLMCSIFDFSMLVLCIGNQLA